MSDRPTPEDIAAAPGDGFSCLERLAEYGYVIVHPDDADGTSAESTTLPNPQQAWRQGWNDCRRHIFGERGET